MYRIHGYVLHMYEDSLYYVYGASIHPSTRVQGHFIWWSGPQVSTVYTCSLFTLPVCVEFWVRLCERGNFHVVYRVEDPETCSLHGQGACSTTRPFPGNMGRKRKPAAFRLATNPQSQIGQIDTINPALAVPLTRHLYASAPDFRRRKEKQTSPLDQYILGCLAHS